ncbi:MAG: antibiotic biosynthesis monooxygenase [Rhodospirillaceae bacterium]|nr:antibiotic biosynthesis monooxygenase [Rhodospirillaceae bacterium]
MGEHVHWMLEVGIAPGKGDAFKALMEEMVTSTRNEPGAVSYDWNISADGASCHIYEYYKDSAATMVHLNNFGKKFAERFLAMAKPAWFFLYGSPNAEVRAALAGLKPTYYQPFGGFIRKS